MLNVHPGQPASAAAAASAAAPARGAASDSDEGGRGGRGGRGGAPGGRGGRGEGQPFGSGYSISSPPALYKDLAIVGASEGENAVVGPAGDPQAFDVKTGKLVWRFHGVPQPGEKNFNTWGDGWKDRGGPAVWGFMTVDTERGLVFVPTGNPGGSFYGGDRPGDNLYAVSVVALDAATGAYKWHFQTTHHDVFDADLAAAPALIDVVRDGKRIPAVAQVTKMGGMLFILDRVTGKPIYPVEERKVPLSKVPGEVSSPTQPFPTKPAPWSRMGMTKADITTVTPESNKFCTEWWEKERMSNDGAYTPYGADGVTVVFSGTIGGANWGGTAFNPQLGYLFVNTSSLATIGHMVPGTGLEKYRNELSYTRFWDDNKYPCQQPPWGDLVAVNVNTGEVAWKIPFGIYPELVAKGIPPTGTPNLGGPIATASGLLFIGATKDARFRAYDAKTGKELWYSQLEAAGGATPMTFMGRNGVQYVVIAAGGPGDTDRGGTETYPQKLVAFALGDRVTPTAANAAPVPAPRASAPAANAVAAPAGAGRAGLGGTAGAGAPAHGQVLHDVPRHAVGNRIRQVAGGMEGDGRGDGRHGRRCLGRTGEDHHRLSEPHFSAEEVTHHDCGNGPTNDRRREGVRAGPPAPRARRDGGGRITTIRRRSIGSVARSPGRPPTSRRSAGSPA